MLLQHDIRAVTCRMALTCCSHLPGAMLMQLLLLPCSAWPCSSGGRSWCVPSRRPAGWQWPCQQCCRHPWRAHDGYEGAVAVQQVGGGLAGAGRPGAQALSAMQRALQPVTHDVAGTAAKALPPDSSPSIWPASAWMQHWNIHATCWSQQASSRQMGAPEPCVSFNWLPAAGTGATTLQQRVRSSTCAPAGWLATLCGALQ